VISAGADERIPQREVQAFGVALGKAGVEHWMVTCEGAPHGFVDRRANEFPEQAAKAWRRVRGFVFGLSNGA
jgi:dienelactone hydrolase